MYIVSVNHCGKELFPERKLGLRNANYPTSNFRVCKWFQTQFITKTLAVHHAS